MCHVYEYSDEKGTEVFRENRTGCVNYIHHVMKILMKMEQKVFRENKTGCVTCHINSDEKGT
jgi:hypothetical protein